MWIVTLNPYVELVQAVVTISAVIVGGIWTYMLFIKGRSTYPRLTLKHSVYTRDIDSELRLLRVTLTIENQSNILVKTGEVALRLLQLDPWPDDIVNRTVHFRHDQASHEWPYIDYRDIMPPKVEIEPGELEEHYFDFVIDRGRRAVIVYSWVQNLQKKEMGWTLSTAYNLDTVEGIKQEAKQPLPPPAKPKEKEMKVNEQMIEVVSEEQTEIDDLPSKAPPPPKPAEPDGAKQKPKDPLPPPARPPGPPPGEPSGPPPGGPSGPPPGGPPGSPQPDE